MAAESQYGKCAYCIIEIGEDVRRLADIEHFADKQKYPSWTFDLWNLFLACKYCNQTRKGRFDTVLIHSDVYESCSFAIVHPYFDNVEDHIVGGFSSDDVEPSIPTPRTLKGLRTIRLFQLDTTHMLKSWFRIYNESLLKREFDAEEERQYELAKRELSSYSS